MAANSYMADAHAQLAFVALELGEAATAAAHMQESRNLLGNSLPAVYLAWLLEGYAGFALAAGRPERAYRLIGAAAALRRCSWSGAARATSSAASNAGSSRPDSRSARRRRWRPRRRAML